MLQKPDRILIAALSTLKGNREFEIVRVYLEQSLQELYRANATTKDEVILRWNQGAIQLIEQFLDMAKNARETLQKFR
jgi:hypothetical protein